MGAFGNIGLKKSRISKRKTRILHSPCTHGWHDLPNKTMMLS
jgi:hypothetical protein